MEAIALSGLLGLGYLISKASEKKKDNSNVTSQQALIRNNLSSQTLPPADREFPLLTRNGPPKIRESFMPAARAPNS